MGTTLANIGPQAGQAAGGFVQGTQLRTQEDQTRQGMALRAAEEGRSKEQHRLNIQQLGLQIQGMQQAQEQASQMFPHELQSAEQRNIPGATISPDYLGGLTNVSGAQIPAGVTAQQGETIAEMQAGKDRARLSSGIAGEKLGLEREKLVAGMASKSIAVAKQQYDAAAKAYKQAEDIASNLMGNADAIREARAAKPALKAEMIRKKRALEKAAREGATLGVEFVTENEMSNTVQPEASSSAFGSWNEED